jgi:hypothetical protein
MQLDDNAPDLNALTADYRAMSDAEITAVARGYDDLTGPVQALVRSEFARRGLEPPVVDEEASVETRKLVTVARFRDLTEAALAQGALESAGIESYLRDTNLVRNDWFYSNLVGGIRMDVAEADVDAAKAVLAQPIPESIALDTGQSYQQPTCPRCGSLEVRSSFALSGAQDEAASASLSSRPGWECELCGAVWTDEEAGGGPAAGGID